MLRIILITCFFFQVGDATGEMFISCTSNRDCPHTEFCDLSLGKRPLCTPCIDCDRYNRHPADVPCVSYVLADCGPCLYGYKDTTHYDPSRRLEKCEKIPKLFGRNIGKRSYDISTLLIIACLLGIYLVHNVVMS